MQTSIIKQLLDTPDGQEADRILRACTHCGFCTATCPTYQVLGDERDSPRGRIYLIKQVLEGAEPSRRTQLHLDRCLTCRACETTCPSGVEYGRLVDVGRRLVDRQVSRSLTAGLTRWGLRNFMAYRRRARWLLRLGRLFRPVLPASLRGKLPAPAAPGIWPDAGAFKRQMLVLDGCIQPSVTPLTNAATARVLARLDIGLKTARSAVCCGALPQHIGAEGRALRFARRNIDAWWPHIQAGAEAIVMTASGCGAQVAEYGYLLRNDPKYADKAARVSQLCCEIGEVLAREKLSAFAGTGSGRQIAWHPPCTLQNAPGLVDAVPQILGACGFELLPVAESHMCCGSAGTYSILQPELAGELRQRKLSALQQGQPELIATANVGCQMHLQEQAGVPVKHWIELLDAD